MIQVFIFMTKKSKTGIIKLVAYSYSTQNVWQHIVLVDLISTVNDRYIWMHLKKVKRWLKDIDQRHKLFILIKLIKRKPSVWSLKLLQKVLDRSKINQVLLMEFTLFIMKILYSKKFFWAQIRKTSETFYETNICTSIVSDNNNVSLWKFLISKKSFRCNKKIIICWFFDLSLPFVVLRKI